MGQDLEICKLLLSIKKNLCFTDAIILKIERAFMVNIHTQYTAN